MYELHAPTMMSVCRRYVCSSDVARDLLHDGFVKLFTRIGTYAGNGSFAGWMRRVFVTTALMYLRQRDVLRYSVDLAATDCAEDEPDVSLFEHLSTDDLLACIDRLPDVCRTVFNMHAIEGYTHVEVAQMLGMNENTVRARYAKARQLLQVMVMDWAGQREAAAQ
jgi:RNA polymerase sigma-70 factor (ECF subfamily)